MTKPESLGGRAVGWPEGGIDKIIEVQISGKTNEEINNFVSHLGEIRTSDHFKNNHSTHQAFSARWLLPVSSTGINVFCVLSLHLWRSVSLAKKSFCINSL